MQKASQDKKHGITKPGKKRRRKYIFRWTFWSLAIYLLAVIGRFIYSFWIQKLNYSLSFEKLKEYGKNWRGLINLFYTWDLEGWEKNYGIYWLLFVIVFAIVVRLILERKWRESGEKFVKEISLDDNGFLTTKANLETFTHVPYSKVKEMDVTGCIAGGYVIKASPILINEIVKLENYWKVKLQEIKDFRFKRLPLKERIGEDSWNSLHILRRQFEHYKYKIYFNWMKLVTFKWIPVLKFKIKYKMNLSLLSKRIEGKVIEKRSGSGDVIKPSGFLSTSEWISIWVTTKSGPHGVYLGITGSGKTQNILFPMMDILSQSKTKHSFIISDVKGELFQTMGTFLQLAGLEIWAINFRDAKNTTNYNPLRYGLDLNDEKQLLMDKLLMLQKVHKKWKSSLNKSNGESESNEDVKEDKTEVSIEDKITEYANAGNLLKNIIDEKEANKKEDEKTILSNEQMLFLVGKQKAETLYSTFTTRKEFDDEEVKIRTKIAEYEGKIDTEFKNVYDAIFVDEKSKDPFWNNAAKNVCLGYTFLLLEEREQAINGTKTNNKRVEVTREHINIPNIASLGTTTSIGIIAEYYGLEKKGDKWELPDGKSPESEKKLREITRRKSFELLNSTLISGGENAMGGVKMVFDEKMTPFKDINVKTVVSGAGVDIRQIGKTPTAVFIIIPDNNSTYNFLVSLFIESSHNAAVELADSNGGKLPIYVNYLLDEFGNFPPIKCLMSMITVGRSRRINVSIALQAFQQIVDKYGKEMETIVINNVNLLTYLLTNDKETLTSISHRMGTVSVIKEKDTATSNSRDSDVEKKEELMNVLELGRIPKQTSVSIVSRTRPAKNSMVYYFWIIETKKQAYESKKRAWERSNPGLDYVIDGGNDTFVYDTICSMKTKTYDESAWDSLYRWSITGGKYIDKLSLDYDEEEIEASRLKEREEQDKLDYEKHKMNIQKKKEERGGYGRYGKEDNTEELRTNLVKDRMKHGRYKETIEKADDIVSRNVRGGKERSFPNVSIDDFRTNPRTSVKQYENNTEERVEIKDDIVTQRIIFDNDRKFKSQEEKTQWLNKQAKEFELWPAEEEK